MKKISTEWLSVCGGCHVSLVDLHDKIIKIFKAFEWLRCPILIDTKDYPDADFGIVTGAIRTTNDIQAAKKIRKSCKHIVAFGTCAVYGGISGAGCVHANHEIYEAVYLKNKTTISNIIPTENLPELTKDIKPLDEVIKVDLYLTGCPPHQSYIFTLLSALSKGKKPVKAYRSVCAQCNRKMVKNDRITELKNVLSDMPDQDTCFLCQGYLCFGPVTLDRCFAPCPNKGVVCSGCCGPTINVLEEPTIDIRIKIAKLMSELTKIPKDFIISEIERFSKTYYAYSMASQMINKKQTYRLLNWIK